MEQATQGDGIVIIPELFNKSVDVVLRVSGHGGDELLVGLDDIDGVGLFLFNRIKLGKKSALGCTLKFWRQAKGAPGLLIATFLLSRCAVI